VLTFNETVGTTPGCYVKDPDSSLLNFLVIGNNLQCTSSNTPVQNGTGNTPQNLTNNNGSESNFLATLIIAVVIGVFSTLVIVVAILMIIPGTRNAIFPRSKTRNRIKKRIKDQEKKKKSLVIKITQ